jgi:hypothetical protein
MDDLTELELSSKQSSQVGIRCEKGWMDRMGIRPATTLLGSRCGEVEWCLKWRW